MSHTRFSTEQQLFAGFAFLFLVTATIYISAYLTISDIVKLEKFIDTTYQYRAQTLEVVSLLKDAETGARGFVLTGKKSYLKPYNEALNKLPIAVGQIDVAVQHEPEQQQTVAKIRRAIDAELIDLKKLVQVRADNGTPFEVEEALDLQKEDMDKIRELYDPVDIASLDRMEKYLHRSNSKSLFARGLFPTLGLAVLALFIVVFRQLAANVRSQKLLLKSEKELKVARDEALEGSRIKSEFVTNMSHEIRTPLSGIMGMSELLTLKNLDEEAEEIASHLLESSRHLLVVVNDLLDFSKLEAGKMVLGSEEFSPTGLIQEVASITSSNASRKGLFLKTEIDPNLPETLTGDKIRLKQVILNLVYNAIKFTSNGGITIEAKSDGNKTRFSVTDTGIGIAPAVQEKLFQPFVQADGSTTRVYGGTGLGLSISKSLVSLMNGEMGVNSQLGEGSTFWVSLPLERHNTQNDTTKLGAKVG
jgi:two-component system, sensor histidine kinase and response regulator